MRVCDTHIVRGDGSEGRGRREEGGEDTRRGEKP